MFLIPAMKIVSDATSSDRVATNHAQHFSDLFAFYLFSRNYDHFVPRLARHNLRRLFVSKLSLRYRLSDTRNLTVNILIVQS